MYISTRRAFGVVGLGTIGRALAFGNWLSATRQGIAVTFRLYELDPQQRAQADGWFAGQLDKLLGKGKVSEAQAAAFFRDVQWVDALEGLADCEAVFEAIVEKLEPKQEVVAQLCRILSDDALVLCTSSGYAPAVLAAKADDPTRVFGYHPFSPADRNLIVEHVGSDGGEPDCEVFGIANLFGRQTIHVNPSIPCFAGNTFFTLYCLTAARLVENGVATVAQINRWTDDELGGSGVFGALDFTGGERGRSGTPIIINCAELLHKHLGETGWEAAAKLFEVPAIMRDRGSRPWLDPEAGDPDVPMTESQREIVAGTMRTAVAWAHRFILSRGILVNGFSDWGLLSRIAFAFKTSVPDYLVQIGSQSLEDAAQAVLPEHLPGMKEAWNDNRFLGTEDFNRPSSVVESSEFDGISIIEIFRPDKRNALNTEVIEGLTRLLEEISPECIGVVLDCTVAGADVSEFAALDEEGLEAYITVGQALMAKIREFRMPVVAAISGPCLGGGLELANACHARMIGQLARIAFPETGLGLIPGFNGTVDTARWWNPALVWEMLLTGRSLEPAELMETGWAHTFTTGDPIGMAIGLIHDIRDGYQCLPKRRTDPILVPPDLADVNKFGSLRIDPAIAEILQDVFRRGLALPLAEASDLECDGILRASRTEAFQRGTAKFRK